MKLLLNNFKHHKKLEIELPDVGLVRIAGRSGAGKSSVLSAIAWALYGKINNVATWDEKNVEVSLSLPNLKVVRSKGPNYLIANEIEGGTSQSEVERVLKMNHLEFSVSSYVSQGQKNSLINLSPSEQLDIIANLSYNGSDTVPAVWKEKINKEIKQLELDYSKNKDILLHQSSRAASLNQQISHYKKTEKPHNPQNLSIVDVEKKLNLLYKEKEKLELSKNEKQADIAKLQNFLNNSEYNLYDKLIASISGAKQQIENLKNSQKQRVDFPIPSFDENEMRKEISKLEEELKTLGSFMGNNKVFISKEDRKNEIQGIINGFKKDSQLIEIKDSLIDDIRKLNSTLANVYKLANEYFIAEDSEKQKECLNKIEVIKKSLANKKQKVESFNLEKSEAESHNRQVDFNEQQITSLERSIKENNEKLDKINLPDKNEISKKVSILKDELYSINVEQTSCSLEIKDLDSLKEHIETYNKTMSYVEQLEKEYKSLVKSNKELHSKESEISNSIKGHTKLLELVTKAALDVEMAIVNEINLRAAYWLDTLLEGKVVAELHTTKKVKSRDTIIDTLNLQVAYCGRKLDRISEELSGGQYSRVVLAFQLALSDLYNSPILMLDESLRGNDSQTIDICLDALKVISKRKLVIIAEHNIDSSYFDEEICL